MNPLWNPAIRSPDTAKTLNLDAWPESHHRAHDPGKPPGTDKTQTHGRSRAACTAYILSCRSHNLTLLRRAHGTAVTWQDLLLPERNAGIHHPPRTGLPLYSVRISLFVTYTPVWNWWSRLQFGLGQRRDGNPPTYHLTYLVNACILYITSISSQPVFGLYLCTTRRPVRQA